MIYKRMLISVPLEFLRQTMGLPKSTRIVRIESDNSIHLSGPSHATIVVEDDAFEPVIPGCHLRMTDALFEPAEYPLKFVGWSHEQEKGAANV